MLNLITGSAGFIGTNLTKYLLNQGQAVIGIDNFSSSQAWKADLFEDNGNYEFIEADICQPAETYLNDSKLLKKHGKIDRIYNLACPASPPRYQKLAFETMDVCTTGVKNILELGLEHDATVLHASTSEVYGNPEVSPQPESYRGNVNTVGPRSCYDEGKRMSETICYEYYKKKGAKIKLCRIFNTYGPYMDKEDGRVVSNFINQALNNEPITIYGDGTQTRSFQYIDDLIEAFQRFMKTEDDFMGPVNLGTPFEFEIKELAKIVKELTNSKSEITFHDLPKDDPLQRRPDNSLAKEKLGWEPKTDLKSGLEKTIEYFSKSK